MISVLGLPGFFFSRHSSVHVKGHDKLNLPSEQGNTITRSTSNLREREEMASANSSYETDQAQLMMETCDSLVRRVTVVLGEGHDPQEVLST